MFSQQKHSMAQQHAGNETIIAQGVKVEGDFSSNGDITIDGELHGTLQTAASLHVGESAVIHANVSAKEAVIAGVIVGNIHVENGLRLLSSSQITGDVSTRSLSVEQGSVINGKITMGKSTSREVSEE